jgi:peptidoglycan hydrolase-like protein with peptidoglycan-binding domain
MKALRVLLLALLTLGLLGAAAFGAVVVLHPDGEPRAATDHPMAPSEESTDDPSETPSPSDEPTQAPKPEFRLEQGDKGVKVRELQSRLYQLDWLPELTTGKYDAATRAAVSGFQDKRHLKATGVVDERTWKRLVAMTKTPTHDQLFNVLHPGPAILQAGATGEQVRDLQARLVSIAWLFGDVTGTYDAATVEAVRGFQEKREIPVTGKVDQRTLDRLHAMTYQPSYELMHNITPEPGALDPRCQTGRALCVDKSTNSLRWVIDGKVQKTLDVRFGSDELPTREGAFTVFEKSRDHVSSLYDTSMPLAMFFSGGQAVHYSPDFAANGYNGASHGCVNVRDYDGISWLFDQVQIGDKVIVYWS